MKEVDAQLVLQNCLRSIRKSEYWTYQDEPPERLEDRTYPNLTLFEALQMNGYDNLHGYSLSAFEDCDHKEAQFYLSRNGNVILWLMPKDTHRSNKENRFFRNKDKSTPIRVWK